jgi:hypothetical protein
VWYPILHRFRSVGLKSLSKLGLDFPNGDNAIWCHLLDRIKSLLVSRLLK